MYVCSRLVASLVAGRLQIRRSTCVCVAGRQTEGMFGWRARRGAEVCHNVCMRAWLAADVEARSAEASELGERGAYITPRALMSILRLSQVRAEGGLWVCGVYPQCIRATMDARKQPAGGPGVRRRDSLQDVYSLSVPLCVCVLVCTCCFWYALSVCACWHRLSPSCALTTPSSAATWMPPSR